ncbi:FadR/GntR family transcriptional regulator [Clostridium peptidivorans]|uniref:FadR/GntR family transcriptional regulator n=1 Tax=Clostridium peptidivorans TaxID=100174 RepID=UPI000BE447F4|nr:FadR/GntR family transcriptional regulator [Clostridium peptidivorans]
MFTPIRNTKVYEQVIEQIKGMITNGVLKKGDRLPSERELVEQLGISRASIREALRSLEIIGLIESKQGEGNFIRENFDNTLFEPLSIMFMLNDCKVEEIFELRKVIEIETAALAAKKITDEEINGLQILTNNMKISEDEDERVKYDAKFHYTIAKASRNFLILSILNTVASLIDSFIKDARKNIINNQLKDNIDNDHEEILNALREHNSDKASESMRKHMNLINKNLIKLNR